MWREYRCRVDQLEPREALAPAKVPITDRHEQEAATEFMRLYRSASNVLGVVKVNPMELVVHQLQIVIQRSTHYRPHVGSKRTWLQTSLLCNSALSPQLTIRALPNAIDAELPHGEFMLGFDSQFGFTIQQLSPHVNVTEYGRRMMLWAGYHRTYARMAGMAPDASDRSLVVALSRFGDSKISPAWPNRGEREMLTGARPPLFRDFFDERFFVKVKLRKKRYELQIRGQIVAIDEN